MTVAVMPATVAGWVSTRYWSAPPHSEGLIKRRSDTGGVREQAAHDGMTTLKQDGILKVFKVLTDIHEVRRVCIK